MDKRKMRRMLAQIARDNHTTIPEVRRELQRAIDEAQSSADPLIREKWRSIPREGEKVTLEELLEYADRTLTQSE